MGEKRTLHSMFRSQKLDFISYKYSLAWQDFYRCLQLQHYFDKNIKGLIQEHISGIIKIFIKACTTKDPWRTIQTYS